MSISRFDLLPPNATQLERDLSRATSSLERVGGPVPIIRTAKRVDIPDSVLPWLIYEYGLSEILPFVDNDQRYALEVGIDWQRIRGTPESLRIALGWVGVNAFIDESEANTDRWAEYQLRLNAPAGEATINKIVAVAELSQPARSRLLRIYAGCDYRRAVYGESTWSEGAIYGDHSGIRPRPEWPQINFCRHTRLLVPASMAPGDAAIAHTRIIGLLAQVDDCFRYGEDYWGEGWHTTNQPVLWTRQEGMGASVADGRSWLAATHWGERTWAESLPYGMLAHTREASGSGGNGGGTTNFQTTWTIVPGGYNHPFYGQQPPTFTASPTAATMTVEYTNALGGAPFDALYTFAVQPPGMLTGFTVTGYFDDIAQPGFFDSTLSGINWPQPMNITATTFSVYSIDDIPEDCVVKIVMTLTRSV